MTRPRRKPGWAACCSPLSLILGFASFTVLVLAYNPEQDQVNGLAVPARWDGGSVVWNLNPTVTGSHVAAGANVQQALTNAFNTWQNASLTVGGQSQKVVNLSISLGQVSSSLPTQPNVTDCLNVVGFVDMSTKDFPTGVIAFTAISTVTPNPGQTPPFQYSCSGGAMPTCRLLSCIVDTDIEFNPSDQFTTAQPTPSGAFDIQTIATHEIGHMLGLDHSGLGDAVMYPYGDTGVSGSATLSVDDAAGIAFLYPAASFAQITGTLAGKITLQGSGIFAAHVVAIDANTGDAVLDGLTAPDGTYSLVGLPPGTYNVLVLPLAGLYDLTNFGGWSCGYDEAANAPPCCDPAAPACNGTPVPNPTNYTGKFF
jgi:hypothetical protein